MENVARVPDIRDELRPLAMGRWSKNVLLVALVMIEHLDEGGLVVLSAEELGAKAGLQPAAIYRAFKIMLSSGDLCRIGGSYSKVYRFNVEHMRSTAARSSAQNTNLVDAVDRFRPNSDPSKRRFRQLTHSEAVEILRTTHRELVEKWLHQTGRLPRHVRFIPDTSFAKAELVGAWMVEQQEVNGASLEECAEALVRQYLEEDGSRDTTALRASFPLNFIHTMITGAAGRIRARKKLPRVEAPPSSSPRPVANVQPASEVDVQALKSFAASVAAATTVVEEKRAAVGGAR